MENIDVAAAKLLAKETIDALQAVAQKHGLTVKILGGKYDPVAGTYAPKVEYAVEGGLQREFEMYARMYNLKPEDFGAEFTNGGKKFRITGLAMNSRKYPVLAEGTDGKTYKFPAEAIAKKLEVTR